MNALQGKRVVVTRAADQADGLIRALTEVGAAAIPCPTIRIEPPESWDRLDAALARLVDYRWVVFTSSNGVSATASRLSLSGRSLAELGESRVAAVGASTARALRAEGVHPAYLPDLERSSVLVETLPDVASATVLLIRADIADPGAADVLRGRGAALVDDVPAYRTLLLPPSGEALGELRRGVDGVTFTSPSTVRGFQRAGPDWRRFLEGVAVVTLGPATTEVALREGIEVAAEARERRMSGLVEALRLTFESTRGDEERAG